MNRTTGIAGAVAVITMAVVAPLTIRALAGGPPSASSIEKLRAIGQALQIYRVEYGVKPPDQRENFADAGLPPSIAVLGLYTERNWSLPSGLESFRTAAPLPFMENFDSHFSQLYPGPHDPLIGTEYDPSGFLATRGENLPILVDFNINTSTEFRENPENLVGVILRLNGAVDVVRFSRTRVNDLLSK